MTILTKAEVYKIRRDVAGQNWILCCANAKDVDNLCITIEAMRAALEAWAEWHCSAENSDVTLREERKALRNKAVKLTKAAGIV